ncbi:MAG: tRNA (adenosine(37)-N6)-threonylcarbamoyltransferase complex transferase subunit TsaD [bacterium]|nr:tRNA (adenosine(37)-N6)-threonylcarbamoyltransferase complex transferase subunit TsaD [bacterium]
MKILAIETSCDETAISIVDGSGGLKRPTFKILSSITLSQAKIHAHYGGVFPAIAKREHSKSLIPILKEALTKARMLKKTSSPLLLKTKNKKLQTLLAREPELLEQFLAFIPTIKKPDVDAIAVTYGPGLEPALWVGINFAKALSLVWNIPIIPVNHMEGHAVAALLVQKLKVKSKKSEKEIKLTYLKNYTLSPVKFPILALLISGGHTELVLTNNLLSYKLIGETRDDAVGEAFDKVARMLGLPYPGGPEISKIAEQAPERKESPFPLPRPMIHSGDFNFSFSGLKTAVLYTIKKIPNLTDNIKALIAREFEEAVTDVLTKKTLRAAEKYGAKTIIIGGGVAANKYIREQFEEILEKHSPKIQLLMSNKELSTDNALMIAIAGYIRIASLPKGKKIGTTPGLIKARGNLRFSNLLSHLPKN